jgi:hypothetical protein
VCFSPLSRPTITAFMSSKTLSENPLRQLINYEVVILMDDSGSMGGRRWNQVRTLCFFPPSWELVLMVRVRQARRVMKGVIKEAIKYDKNGIEIQFLNSARKENAKVRPHHRELSTSWPDLDGSRIGISTNCSGKLNQMEGLHSADVWVISAINTSMTWSTAIQSVALSSPSQMAHRVSRSVFNS